VAGGRHSVHGTGRAIAKRPRALLRGGLPGGRTAGAWRTAVASAGEAGGTVAVTRTAEKRKR
jgi:hypothetical protein